MSSNLYIDLTSEKGRGVFTYTPIRAGELIEAAPVLIFTQFERAHLDQTILRNYYFSWRVETGDIALVLGYGSLYNHSYTPNARYVQNLERTTIDFVSIRNIEKGEEITVNYNGDPDDPKPVWFDAKA